MSFSSNKIAQLSLIADQIKPERYSSKAPNPALQLRYLAEKITEDSSFSWKQFKEMTKISEHTLRSWLNELVNQPQKSTLEAVRRYLRVSEENLDDYVKSTISLDALWQSRNQDLGTSLSLNDVTQIIASFSTTDKLALISQISKMVQADMQVTDCTNDTEAFIVLTDNEKVKLKVLLEASLIYSKESIESLLSKGVDGALLQSIVDCFKDDSEYTEEVYSTLTPFLLVPIQWMQNVPLLDSSKTFELNTRKLFKALS